MSSLTSGPNLSAAFIDLATYGELEKRLYGNYPQSSDNFLTYERFSFLNKAINLSGNFKIILIIVILFVLLSSQ